MKKLLKDVNDDAEIEGQIICAFGIPQPIYHHIDVLE